MAESFTNYFFWVLKAKSRLLLKILFVGILAVTFAVRMLPLPYKAQVQMVTHLSEKNSGLFSLDRNTFIASQEVLLKSQGLYEAVQRKAESDLAGLLDSKTSKSFNPQFFLQSLLFGKKYAEAQGIWNSSAYEQFKNRISIAQKESNGLFTIEYTDPDPVAALRITQYIVDSLVELNTAIEADDLKKSQSETSSLEVKKSRLYPLQKPALAEGWLSSGKSKFLFALLALLAFSIPLVASGYYFKRGALFSTKQMKDFTEPAFIGQLPVLPSNALPDFCSSEPTVLAAALACARRVTSGGTVITLANATNQKSTESYTLALASGLKNLNYSVLVVDCSFLKGFEHSVSSLWSSQKFDEIDFLSTLPEGTHSPSVRFTKMVSEMQHDLPYIEELKETFFAQIESLRSRFDFILLEGPVLSTSEGTLLAECADGIVVCCAEGNVSKAELLQTVALIQPHTQGVLMSLMTNSRMIETPSSPSSTKELKAA